MRRGRRRRAAFSRFAPAVVQHLRVEAGSGPGNLTERLAARARHVWAFEVDPDLHAFSREMLKERGNITWIHVVRL